MGILESIVIIGGTMFLGWMLLALVFASRDMKKDHKQKENDHV